jgi:hypothetical protein
MEGSLFDRLTQIVGGSRRSALRTAFGGAALATAGLMASTLESSAKKKKKCKKKTCPECPVCEPLDIGEACQTNVDCCPNETNAICSFVQGNIQRVCCGVLGASCTDTIQCCFAHVCFGGQCVVD